jgi:hypothetical protein
MAKYTHKDGELRIMSGVTSNSPSGMSGASDPGFPIYVQLLFTNADLNIPLGRPRPEEILNLDRGNADDNMSYAEGSDEAIMAPQPFSISCKLDDTTYSRYLLAMMSGATGSTWGAGTTLPMVLINNKRLISTKGQFSGITIGAGSTVATPPFADNLKMAYNVEVIWDGSTDNGRFLGEVYFPPEGQTIVEAEDVVNLNLNGQVYGDIQPISTFFSRVSLPYQTTLTYSGTTIQDNGKCPLSV